MNRLILLLLLIGVGVYLYVVLYKNNNYFSNSIEYITTPPVNHELINDEFIEQPMTKQKDKHVNFSEKTEEFIIPNKDDIKENNDNLYNDIFIINPIDMENTNLTLSENEYFSKNV